MDRTEKLALAARMHAAVETYFAHWSAELDASYDAALDSFLRRCVDEVGRNSFAMAALAFFASLKNGHSDVGDPMLWQNGPLGFYAQPIEDQWTVTSSSQDQLRVGDVITKIDGSPIHEFFAAKRDYIAASDGRAAANALFFRSYLFSAEPSVTLASGQQMRLGRATAKQGQSSRPPSLEWKSGIPVLRIYAFDRPEHEETALALLADITDAERLVIDVHGNSGGSTPMRLIAKLMDRPFPMWRETYRYLDILGDAARSADYPASVSRRTDRPRVDVPATLFMPDDRPFRGKLAVVVDSQVYSAAEDFVMPLGATGRALVVGERTGGSSGQPYVERHPNGISFRVGAKRQFFPDGSEFEGVGIAPGVHVPLTHTDLVAGRHSGLERALELLSGTSSHGIIG